MIRPRGVIFYDGGMAKDSSGRDGLPILDVAGIAAATVDAMSARMGDPRSTYETGVVSALNDCARRAGVEIGQFAREAAQRTLEAPRA